MTRTLNFPLTLRCPNCNGTGSVTRRVDRTYSEPAQVFDEPCNCPPERTVQVHATLNWVSGEPGSLSIAEGWEIDQCHVKYPDGAEIVATDEKQIDQAVREAAGKLQR